MEFQNWTIDHIDMILPEEFHELIASNKKHISKTFPETSGNCSDLDATVLFIKNCIVNQKIKENYYFYLRSSETKKLIGYVCIKKIDYKIMKCELAYFIDSNYEGKGIISQTVSNTIDFCFNELQMSKICICTSKINIASQSVATKYGFQQEGILREEFKNDEGILEDIVYFGLLKSEYHER